MEKFNARFVNIKGRVYISVDDLATLLSEFAGAEESDVRNRINELKSNICYAAVRAGKDGL